ncbi:PEP-utilizing enzyme [Frigidibacter sp. SD6-1]|uniref:PEP-utilizing enzyme n=1 Tax=Frigidibacter sp. SD6-1 TaxID=3032581 RepID=UPI0024DFBE92|nr:PEP-utilizing enzyme [Frigidibacter sp. SD6-1]
MTIASEIRFPPAEETAGFFVFDKMHSPRPLRPLASDLVVKPLAEGFTRAQAEYDSPLVTGCKTANYYSYVGFNPHPDPAVIEDRMSRYMGFIERTVPTIGKRWTDEWLPMVRERNEAERDRDYSAMSDEEIFARYFEMIRWMEQMWYIHGHINFALVSGSALSDFYDEVMRPEDPTEAYQILQGYHTRPVDAAHGLWKLSRAVKSDPLLSKAFDENHPRDLKAVLEGSERGRDFLVQLDEYLYDFGWRTDAVYDLADVPWRENPAIPLGVIARYVAKGEGDDPMIAFNDSVRRREERTAAIRQRLAGDSAKLAKFEELFASAKYAYPLTEDHAFYIDQMGVSLMRRFVRVLGERLAARGCLETGDDIFYLYDREVRGAMANDTDHRALVVARKADFEACSKLEPAPFLGTPPPPPVPGAFVDPFMDAMVTRLLGVKPPPEGEQDPDVIDGVAGSPGCYTGTARVVRSLEEAGELKDGEVMVCEMTLPPWVPMFAIAGAVVADVGGVMGHCAIVAREFGLPAVVGAVDGTVRIKTGQVVTVDGTNGNVYLDGRAL